ETQGFAPDLGRLDGLANPIDALRILLVGQNAELRRRALIEASLLQCRPCGEPDRQVLDLARDRVGEPGCPHPFPDLARCRIPASIDFENIVEVLVDVPLIDAGMRVQTDGHHQPGRNTRIASARNATKHFVKRLTCPRQTLSTALRESGGGRSGLRISQHPSRGVQARHANPTTADEPKPMAGAATDLEYTQAELLADEGNKRSFDTRVV